MKRIEEMSQEEMLALTPDAIQKVIDYACALEGLPLEEMGPTKPVAPAEPDMTLYRITEVSSMYVGTLEDAQKVLDALKGVTLYSTDYVRESEAVGYKKIARPLTRPASVSTEDVFSPEMWAKVKEDYTEYAELMKQYLDSSRATEEASSARKKIADWVWKAIRNARRREEYKQELIRAFDRYLILADGNRTIAYRFLEAACSGVSAFPELVEMFTQAEEGPANESN